MNPTQKLLHQVAKNSNGKMRIVPLPPERTPTKESLEKLEREIHAQLMQNQAMHERTYINAFKF